MTIDNGTRNRWLVRAAALAIFLLGAVAGTLAPRAYYNTFGRHSADARRGGGEQMFDRLQLDEGQRAQARQIFADTRGQLEALRRESEPRVVEIRRQADERLQKVLTPEQWQRFQQMKAETRGRGRRGRDGGEPAPVNAR
jgi:Spy/CpxP family protein refolding chaperone